MGLVRNTLGSVADFLWPVHLFNSEVLPIVLLDYTRPRTRESQTR